MNINDIMEELGIVDDRYSSESNTKISDDEFDLIDKWWKSQK